MARTPGSGFVTEAMLEDALSGSPTGGTGVEYVSGTVNLSTTTAGTTLREFVTTGSTTFTQTGRDNVVIPADKAVVWMRVGGVWGYKEVDGWTTPAASGGGTTTVTATSPAWTDDTVNGGGTWTSPSITGLTYSPASGSASPGQSVTVNVTAQSGYNNTGPSSFSHTFPTAPADPLPTGPVSVSMLHSAANTSTSATQTYTAVPLGTPHSHRLIVVAALANRTTTRTISSATIGGVSATVVNTSSGSSSRNFAYAVVPTGTSGDITLTFSGTLTDGDGGSQIEVAEVVNTLKNHSASVAQATAIDISLPAAAAGDLHLIYAVDISARLAEFDPGDVLTSDGKSMHWKASNGAAETVTLVPTSPAISRVAITFPKA